MVTPPTVLVCPLDWGTGHATRCVPVIRKFIENGFRVIIAADGKSHDFLKNEFPELKMIRFSGIRIRYSAGKNLVLKIALQTPLFLYGIFREHHILSKMIRKERPTVVFSDNRYGLWSRKAKCIFMTHQVRVILPGFWKLFSGCVNWILGWFVKKFDECWVPDEPHGNGLAGMLSHPRKTGFPVHYVGILSRFISHDGILTPRPEPENDFLVIISGPEPQRTVLEEIILKKFLNSKLKGNIITGRIGEHGKSKLNENISVFKHINTHEMFSMIMDSAVVICRPGYSSLMDLATLGKNAILIPTPGQTEQEYLAEYLMDKGCFFSAGQEHFDPEEAIRNSTSYGGIRIINDLSILTWRIRNLLPEKII